MFARGAFRRGVLRFQNFLGVPSALQPLVFSAAMIQVLAAGHLIGEYGFQASSASGASMLPTVSVYGDWLLVNRLHRHGRGIRVGDLVMYKIPGFNGAKGVKRVIGMPGDYVLLYTPGATGSDDPPMTQVPQGHCWIAGDNLAASRDSRLFGPVPLALVQGKVTAKIFPLSEAQWLHNPLDPEPAGGLEG